MSTSTYQSSSPGDWLHTSSTLRRSLPLGNLPCFLNFSAASSLTSEELWLSFPSPRPVPLELSNGSWDEQRPKLIGFSSFRVHHPCFKVCKKRVFHFSTDLVGFSLSFSLSSLFPVHTQPFVPICPLHLKQSLMRTEAVA